MSHPPGPRGLEVLGFFQRSRYPNPLAFLHAAASRYGPLTYFRLLHQPTFLVTGPDLVKEVLVTQQQRFGRDFGASILRELVGDAMITREEPLHRERRRVLQPAFHKEQISSYVSTMADAAHSLAGDWSAQLEAADLTVDIGASMRALTLSIIGRLLFGEEFRAGANRISEILAEVMKRARRLVPFATVLKLITRGYRRTLPRGPSLYFGKYRAELDRILQPMIERRRAQAGRDVLSLLLALHDEDAGSLSSEDIRNEMVTFVLAGHETTATALTWTLYQLADNTAIQDRASAEIEAVCAGRPVRADDLPRLVWTSAIFQETLRLYPPVPLFGRRVLEEASLGGYQIPKRATLLLSPYITQRSDTSFAQAANFDPARWLDAAPPSRFAFFPFGGGAKMCIGDIFAKTEAVTILASLLQTLRFELTSELPPEVDPGVTLKPKQPIFLNVSQRRTSPPASTQSAVDDHRTIVASPLAP